MKTYILTIIGVALVSAAVIILTPKNQGILKHVKFLASVALVCVLAEPIFALVSELGTNGIDSFLNEIDTLTETDENYESIFYENLSKLSANELQTELKKQVCAKFGIDEKNLNIRAEYSSSGEGIKFSRILITLSGAAILKDPREIESYVKDLTNLHCDCVI